MMRLEDIAAAARRTGLAVVGSFHPEEEDKAPGGAETLVLFGADGPDMWEAFAASPEHADGQAHPMDRWSTRVIGALGVELEAEAFFPFGGPPWHPFQRWAERGEGAVASPVQMQATAARGLWTSYRGALAFRERIALPARVLKNACQDCPAPCLAACPVDAFASGRYDVPHCTAHVQSEAGMACRTGCLVRKACPAGKALVLPKAERIFHMDAFLRANGGCSVPACGGLDLV